MAQPDPGVIVLPTDVATAVKATLEEWVPYYLGVIDVQQGRECGTTEAPSWTVSTDLDRWLEEVPPAGLVVSRGMGEDPERHGDDASYGGWFDVTVGVTAGGATEKGSYDIAGRLSGAVFYTLAQQADIGGLAEDTRVSAPRIEPTRNRKRTIIEVPALVRVRRIVATRGPLLPLTAPDPPCGEPDDFNQPSDFRVRATAIGGDE